MTQVPLAGHVQGNALCAAHRHLSTIGIIPPPPDWRNHRSGCKGSTVLSLCQLRPWPRKMCFASYRYIWSCATETPSLPCVSRRLTYKEETEHHFVVILSRMNRHLMVQHNCKAWSLEIGIVSSGFHRHSFCKFGQEPDAEIKSSDVSSNCSKEIHSALYAFCKAYWNSRQKCGQPIEYKCKPTSRAM